MLRRTFFLLILSTAVIAAQAQGSQPVYHICKPSDSGNGPCATAPKPKHIPDPKYSEQGRQANLEGAVTLWMVVGADGRTHDVQVVKALGMGLDEEAVKAVSHWTFEPAKVAGKPVPVQMNVVVNFRLYKNRADAAKSPQQSEPADTETPEMTAGGGSSEANETFRSALASLRARDYAAAATTLKRVVELDPAHRYAWNWLCLAQFELKQYEEAAAACRRQIAINPEDRYSYNNLGRVLRAEGKLAEAEGAFRTQIAIDPQDRWAHANLGLLLRQEKKCPAAVTELLTAIDIAPKNTAARNALRDCYVETGQNEKADQLLTGAATAASGSAAAGPAGISAPEGDYYNAGIGIKIHVPESWRVTTENAASYAQPAQASIAKLGSLATLVLVHHHLEASAKTYRSMVEEQMSRNEDFQRLGQERVIVDGVAVECITLKFVRSTIEMRAQTDVFSDGDEHYTITAAAPADIFDRYVPAFESMLESLRFSWRHPEEKFASTVPLPDSGAFTQARRVRVSSGMAQTHITKMVEPEYPAEAKKKHLQGAVVLHAVIDKEGAVKDLSVMSGLPELSPAALEAVRQWRYEPYLFDGEPVDVETQITVNFRLTEKK